MKCIVLFMVVAACLAFDKDLMLKHNKISNEPVGSISAPSACKECQSLVHRFSEAVKDPKKMAELKMLLDVLCHETSYVDECRVFVSRLDVILKKLEPYLNDAQRVCKYFHMCSNSRLDAFHRIGLLYVKRALNENSGMKDLVCDECQFAAHELKIIVEDQDKQKDIRNFLSENICLHMGRYQGMCDELVEQFLPELFQELDALLKDPKQVCADIGFCPHAAAPRKLTPVFAEISTHPVRAFFEAANTVQTTAGNMPGSCLMCVFFLDEFVNELIANKEKAAGALQLLACDHLLPSNYSAGCHDFLSLYLPTVLYMTYKQFVPEKFCTYIRACSTISMSRMNQLSKSEVQRLSCMSCTGLQDYFKTIMDRHETVGFQHFVIEELKRSVCDRVGDFGTACDRFITAAAPRLLSKWSDLNKHEVFCKKIHPSC